jgi:hypothetical protein
VLQNIGQIFGTTELTLYINLFIRYAGLPALTTTMRVLMLHVYAQTGDTFRRKLRRLEDKIRGSHPNASFMYLDGPIKLDVADKTMNNSVNSGAMEPDDQPELRAWFYLPRVVDPASGLQASLDYMATVLARYEPFDGAIAFSQGTVIATMMASLSQGQKRRDCFENASHDEVMQYPVSFLAIDHPPLKFAVFYASRVADCSYYQWLYENPHISTPFCLFFGLWDSMVEQEEQDAALRMLCRDERSRKYCHNRGHFVPSDRVCINVAAEFIMKRMTVNSAGPDPIS